MAGTPRDYIQQITADYSATQLDITPWDVIVEDGGFNQDTVEFDDNSVAVMTRSTIPEFFFRVKWDVLYATDAAKILDFYFDPQKAKGKARTFEFPHPTDGYIYIVNFWSEISRSIRYLHSISEITLKVRGYK